MAESRSGLVSFGFDNLVVGISVDESITVLTIAEQLLDATI